MHTPTSRGRTAISFRDNSSAAPSVLLAWARVAPGARRAPKFRCLIAFFGAQIARKFCLSDYYCENKNEHEGDRVFAPFERIHCLKITTLYY